jgi:hypothetical protein
MLPSENVLCCVSLDMVLALQHAVTACVILQNLPPLCFNGFSTLLAPANEVVIPPELLSSKTVWTPDRELGNFLYHLLSSRTEQLHGTICSQKKSCMAPFFMPFLLKLIFSFFYMN